MRVFQMNELEEGIAQLLAYKENALVLITSGKNADGVYWCRDCEVAAPHY